MVAWSRQGYRAATNDGAMKKIIGGANFKEKMNQKGIVFTTHHIHIL
jgi:hypothetical protein